MSDPTDPTAPDLVEQAAPSRTVWVVVGVVVVVVVATIGFAVWLAGDDADEEVVVGDTSTTVAESTSTEAPTTDDATTTTEAVTTTEAGPGTLDPADVPFVMWPAPDADTRYDDPVDAATDFASDLVGFTDPVVGEFMQGDSRSGEVEVRPSADGPATTVLVRQYGSDDSWWVIGAVTADVTITTPEPQATVTDPMLLEGTALAFEGTVLVSVVADGSTEPFATGFVTGSGTPPAGPFSGEIELGDDAPSGWATVILYTDSAEDGRVWSATATRVQLPG